MAGNGRLNSYQPTALDAAIAVNFKTAVQVLLVTACEKHLVVVVPDENRKQNVPMVIDHV